MLINILLLAGAAITIVLLINLLRALSGKGRDEQVLQSIDKVEKTVRDEIKTNREETAGNASSLRKEISDSTKSFSDTVESKLNYMRDTVEKELKHIQQDNSQKLEQIRATVDEKLQTTLEKRLGESFKQVSDRLEQVHKGLGEMQTLASGVGDLKNLLSNVKTRGIWGEIQLGNLLDQILAPEQYGKNIATKKGSRENVEYAIKMPGKDNKPVWIPIDAKFPREDYERLLEAQEQANPALVEELGKAIEARIKSEAKDIRDKYIDPPHTTDFGILYLPIEGLFAEVLRRPGLCEFLQREYRVAITGPTTIAAFLNSLQMGFRTLAIEKRASEVWNLLGTVKKEFGTFGDILDKTHKQLQAASNTIETATKKTRTIQQKLRDVEVLPGQEPAPMIEEGDLEND